MRKNSKKSTVVVPVVEPVAPAMTEAEANAMVSPDPIPTAKVTLPARPIKTVATDSAASSRYKGIGSLVEYGIPGGLRRNEFQDRLLARNEDADMHWDDDRLAAAMDVEHPEGGVRIADRPELVQVIRKFYNAGKHGKQQTAVPEVQSLQYAKPAVRVKKSA